MKSTLSATHLLRQYLLFALTITFLLTMTRAGLALWQFPHLEKTDAFVALFVQGLRFDLALVGMLSLIPVVVGSLLSMVTVTRPLAKLLIVLLLFGGFFIIVVMEMITPWFIHTQGMRPDMELLRQASGDSLTAARTVLTEQPIPAVIAIVLSALILFAYWGRMEFQRFLRYRTSVPAGLMTAIGCGILCVFAVWSTPDLRQPALGPDDAAVSDSVLVNNLAMNSTYKTLHSIARFYSKN